MRCQYVPRSGEFPYRCKWTQLEEEEQEKEKEKEKEEKEKEEETIGKLEGDEKTVWRRINV